MFRSVSGLLCLAVAIPAAHAAQSYDNCTGFVTALPATINTQGTWCLRADLNTAMASGAAITIGTNNVTLDCNHFKLGGLAAGPSTGAVGVYSLNRANVTVRNCAIRGFSAGVWLSGAAGGHLVEHNRVDASRFMGIAVEGEGSIVRGNQVLDTGVTNAPRGIYTQYTVDVLDNTISNVVADPLVNSHAWGIYTVENLSGRIAGNAVRGLVGAGTGAAIGMQHFFSGRVVVRNNDLVGAGTGWGVVCDSTAGHAQGNMILGYGTQVSLCTNDGNIGGP